MPIAESTVVNKVRKSRTTTNSAKRERSVKEEIKRDADEDITATLFEIKESKYHEDMFARDSRNK